MNEFSATLADRRRERTHLFLVATLSCDGACNPVRVRNLSATGALVEGASLPPEGSDIALRRGALEAAGNIIWLEPGKAGLRFTGLVDVQAWLPFKESRLPTEVDPIAFGRKHAGYPKNATAAPAVEKAAMTVPAAVAELLALRADLERLGGKLAADAMVLARHPEVKFLDAAAQHIGRIIAVLGSA